MIGTDLGTSISPGALFQNGQTQLTPNALGHPMTPSAVGVDAAGSVLVGLAAREEHATTAQHTALAFKRFMGTDRVVKLRGQSFGPKNCRRWCCVR